MLYHKNLIWNQLNLLIWVRSFSFASVCVWSEFWHMHNNGSEINSTHVDENFKNAILMNNKTTKCWHNQEIWKQFFPTKIHKIMMSMLCFHKNILMTYSNFKPISLKTRFVMRQETVAWTKTELLVTKFSSLHFIKRLQAVVGLRMLLIFMLGRKKWFEKLRT